ncbi:MAG: site-specific integrase [Armatimonadota bacterium]
MSDITLHDAALEYLEHLKSEGKSPRTIYTYQKDIDQIESYFGADRKLTSILIPHVSKFLKSDALLKLPSGKERSEPTIKKTVRVFRMFLVWALGKGYIMNLPIPKDLPMGHSTTQTMEVPDASNDSTDN